MVDGFISAPSRGGMTFISDKSCPFCGGSENNHHEDCYIELILLNRSGEESEKQWKLLRSGEAWNTRSEK